MEKRKRNTLGMRNFRMNNPHITLYHLAKQRARRDGFDFNLSKEDIVIPAVCPVLGVELKVNTGGRVPTDNSPTLDRIHPKIGYIKGNIIVISSLANKIKSSANYRQILSVGRWLKGLTDTQLTGD
jgi:hypothetical protein